ncbi:TPR and ankyrin repeat-containing protein 1 isoform X2 [Grus americana]|uniref:TPR and ankyrin repeat-containing protein 1 isoform X2 n=2 Tax=Grus americana TaxID=9117 RepID=UPI0024079F51|nr:TPR and ankyrin repeat-containing protein 1 isoform X2 [Grus americana]
MRKDFSRLPGQHIITWLLRCWDNGASSLELEGREAKQLGSLSREGGIDKAIGKKAQALSLWRRLLSSVRERYPFSEDVVCRPGKWTTMERGIQYLRELAVREMVYYDPDNAQLPTDPDEVQCTRPMWRKFVRSAPSSMDAMEHAQLMRQAGNQDFKNGNYSLAIRKYDQALHILGYLMQWVPCSRDIAVLHCNKSTALYNLGKWTEAVFSAYQSLHWDPEYVKAYYRAGHSLIMLSDSYEAISMFHKGLILLNASADRTQVADFVAGIFISVNDEQVFPPTFPPAYDYIFSARFDALTWQAVIERLAQKGKWRSCLLLLSEKKALPANLRVNQLSLKNLFETSELYGHGEKMQEVAELVKWLISIGAKVETIGVYPLHVVMRLCIRARKNHLFRWLLTQRPDLKDRINQQDRDGCTLLHIVASSSEYFQKRSQTDDVIMLLNFGVDPTVPDARSRYVIDILKKNKNFDAVKAVSNHIEKHTSSEKRTGRNESRAIADRDSLLDGIEQFVQFYKFDSGAHNKNVLKEDAVKRFLKLLSSVKEIPEGLVCNISHACANSFIKQLLEKQMWHKVLLLLTGKASGEEPSNGGLFKNCSLSDVDIGNVIQQCDRSDKQVHLIRCLIERGALPDGIGTSSEIPLQICLKKNYFELVYLLLTKGADPRNVSIAQGDTPLHVAVSICLNNRDGTGLNILNYLLDLFASRPSDFPYLNPNIQDENGNTVMHVVFQRGFSKQAKRITESLAKFDVNFNIKNKLGRDVRHRIKKNDPLLLAWNTAALEKKKYRQDIAGQSAKTSKPIPASEISQAKSAGHSSSGSSLKAPSGKAAHNDLKTSCSVQTKKDQLPKQETERINNPLTLQESLVQAITALIQQLTLGDTLRKDHPPVQKPSSAQTNLEEGRSESLQPCGSVAYPEGKGDDWEKKKGAGEFSVVLPDGEKEEPEEEKGKILDIEAYVQEFDNMTWEIECTPEMLKTLGSKAVPHYLKTKTIMTIKQLGNGEWTRGLQKPLKHLKADIQLYEAKLGKGARMLWELAIDFSPRCSESAEKIMETEQTKSLPEKSGRVYTEIIRIWAIVLDHCKLNRVLENICISYNRGLSCILRKKLKGINEGHQNHNVTTQKRVPRCYVEDPEAEKSKEHTIPEYFPPASAAELEYNIMKFHSFSTNMALNIINDVHSSVEYPFRVGELEYAVIDLNPKPMEPIILIGRSGTGKTTCCLYRLWKKFYSYWEKSTLANGPLLERQTWQQRQCSEVERDRLEKEESELKQDSDDSSEEQVSDEQDQDSEDEKVPVGTAGVEMNSCDDHEDGQMHSAEVSNRLEHLHQIFVTKNPVLCQEVQKNFIELSKSSKVTSHFKPLEPNVHKLQDIKDENFPLFVTSKQLLLLLDASMPDPFFPRNEDGSLKRIIVGWSPQEDMVVPNWQDEDEEGNVEAEHSDDEGPADAYCRESDPRTFVTYDVFANEIWPKMIKGKSPYNPALVWKEIKSFLKGSFEALSCFGGKLTEEQYKMLGRKRSPNFTEDRSEIYHLFCLYQQIRSQRGYFDEEDLLYNLSQRLSKLRELPWSIHEFYGDEIQDFTQAELALLMRCINDPNTMFLTGDTAQSIMKGVAFRFSDLRSLFHYASKNSMNKKQRVRKPKRIYQLYQNYRSHSGILRLAAGVVDLLQHYFPESFDRLPKDCGLFDGPKPTVLESCSVSDLAILLRGNKRKTQPIEFGAHQVVLVANETAKEKIPEELSLALVLTVYEAKGLEFDDVLLYNFFTDSEASKEWKIISSYAPDSDVQAGSKLLIEMPFEDATGMQKRTPFNVEMYKMLNGELKQLYTAITRARVNLWIFDEDSDKRAPAFKYFIKREFVQVVKADEKKDLDDSMFAKTSTPEEWIAQGDYYAKHQFWEVAAKCYQKGGAAEKSKLALAHDAVLKVHSKKSSPREKQMEYMSLAKTYLECGEPKLSLKCLFQSKEFRLCAELCKKLGKIKDAAVYYQKSQCYKEASECYEEIEEFDLAIKMYCQEELYEEAAKAVERYEEMLNTKGQMVSKLSCTANQLYLEAAAKYLSMNRTEEMMQVLSKLDIEDQLEFLKSRGCLRQTADLLKREGREEEAAKLMKQHGFPLEAANLTTIKEFRASCLLAAARASVTRCSESDLVDVEVILREALELCEQTEQKSGIAEAVFFQGALKGDFTKLSRAYCQFLSLNHAAGAVEALFALSHCSAPSQNILFMATRGLMALLSLVRALKKAATNAEKEMVKSCFAYFGIVPTGDSCQVSQNEAEPILKFLSDKPSLKERKTKGDFSVSTEEVKSALKQHLLSRLCSITHELLNKHYYPDICMKFIVGLNCEDKTCEDYHKPLMRHEAKTIFQCKMHLVAINGLLLEATHVFPKELLNQCKSFDDILTANKYASCKALLEMFFPNHFHLRILSENPKACKEILEFSTIISKPCRAVLKEYITFKFKNEGTAARRESTDLWLTAMQAFILSSGYPEEFEKLLFKEEDDYNKELNFALSKANNSPKSKGQGGKTKGIEGRHGMLLPDKNAENAGRTHLCFIRLLENSLEQFYVHKNPENCKRFFFRFMNVLVKKGTRYLIPSIGNTVMLLEFQYILCCAVLMRLSKNITLCFPKSYIALIHYWEFLFRSKDNNKELRDTFSIIQEYRPKDAYVAVQNFRFHLCYLAEVLCGVHGRFNVLLDAFEDPDRLTSGEAERTVVLCLVMLLNADQVQNSKYRSLLCHHFPQIKVMLKLMRKDSPSKVPERLLRVVELVNDATHIREIAVGLQELLTERDAEYLVDCRWKWDSAYTQGHPPIRGILYETINLDRFMTSLDKTEYADELEDELERVHCLEDQKDPLEVIALSKQQKQEQKASAQRQLRRVFHFVSLCMKWKRKACSKAETVAMEGEEFLSEIFKKADIDQTQCDLCGVRFIQSSETYFSRSENVEGDTSEAVTPTEISGEKKLHAEENSVSMASEAYIEHRNTDEHRNNNAAYKYYADFFRRKIDPIIYDGLEVVEAITERTYTQDHLAYKEGSNLCQRKIKENIKKISDAVEEIYERKAWAKAEEIITKHANKLVATIDEARKGLKKMDCHRIKEEGFVHDRDLENEVEDESTAFEELVCKKLSRKKGRYGK